MSEIKNKAKRHAELSWKLIEAKLLYYLPDLFSERVVSKYSIPDSQYDMMDVEYLSLCRELGVDNTISHNTYPGLSDVKGKGMFEVDLERPSVQLAIGKLRQLGSE